MSERRRLLANLGWTATRLRDIPADLTPSDEIIAWRVIDVQVLLPPKRLN